jgi:methionyl aminopeptidase
MSIKTAAQFRRLHRAGRLVARTLDAVQEAIAPGVTTRLYRRSCRARRLVRELTGHGIGRKMHETPTVYNWPSPRAALRLESGLVMTVEPMLVAGRPEIAVGQDGWTVETVDRSLAAHEEHTIVVTDRGPVVLTLDSSPLRA